MRARDIDERRMHVYIRQVMRCRMSSRAGTRVSFDQHGRSPAIRCWLRRCRRKLARRRRRSSRTPSRP